MAEIEDDARAGICESEAVACDINQDRRRIATSRAFRERVIVVADDEIAPAAACAAAAGHTLAVNSIAVAAIRAGVLIDAQAAIAAIIVLIGVAAGLRISVIIGGCVAAAAGTEPIVLTRWQRSATAVGVVGPRVGIARGRRRR